MPFLYSTKYRDEDRKVEWGTEPGKESNSCLHLGCCHVVFFTLTRDVENVTHFSRCVNPQEHESVLGTIGSTLNLTASV